jgi:hypothetical protein
MANDPRVTATPVHRHHPRFHVVVDAATIHAGAYVFRDRVGGHHLRG